MVVIIFDMIFTYIFGNKNQRLADLPSLRLQKVGGVRFGDQRENRVALDPSQGFWGLECSRADEAPEGEVHF